MVVSEPFFEPKYSHEGDGAADIFCAEAVEFAPFERKLIKTGIAIEIPDGFAGFILPRSGLALKRGLTVVNAPGLVDSGYRGELKIALVNLSPNGYDKIEVGDRVAQLLIMPIPAVTFEKSAELSPSKRANAGFGSTGVNGPARLQY